MRVLIASFGTRGDIQPFAALGKGLRERGHEVTLAAPASLGDLAARAGVQLRPAGTRLLTLLQHAMPGSAGARDSLKAYGALQDAQREQLDEILNAAGAARPDLIVYHPKCLAGPHLAEAFGVPGVLSLPLPFYTPTRAFPIPVLGGASFGGWGNRASYLLTRMATVAYGGMINDFRRRLGLGRMGRLTDPLRNPDGSPVHVLYPFSQHVVPVPADYPPTAHVTGYWFLDDNAWQPPSHVLDFLEAGEPPVYVGFGSMGFGAGADERREAVFDALRANRLRGIVATGWGGIASGDSPADDILVVDAVPHEWLFPRVAAVVHHGGAGTVAAGLRAGRPTLVCPFLGDQPFWGSRVQAIGAGPRPVSVRRFAARLAPAVRELTNGPGYRHRADELGRLITSKDGTAAAAAIIQDIATS